MALLVVHKEVINGDGFNDLIVNYLSLNILLMLTTRVNCGILFGLVFVYF